MNALLSFNITAILAAVVGLLIGGLILPKITQAILKGKYSKLAKWWYGKAEQYQRRLEDDPEFNPDKKDSGSDGALAIWRDDVQRAALLGNLPKDRFDKAVELGILEDNDEYETSTTENDVEAKYCRKSIPANIVTSIMCAVCGYVCVALGLPGMLYLPFLVVLALLALCDQLSNILPFEFCYLEYPLALLPLFLSAYSPGILSGIACAVALFVTLLATNAVCSFLGTPNAVGKGDMRLLPACGLILGATMPALLGLCVMGFSMCIGALIIKISRHGDFGLHNSMPMGMYIALGTISGLFAMFWIA